MASLTYRSPRCPPSPTNPFFLNLITSSVVDTWSWETVTCSSPKCAKACEKPKRACSREMCNTVCKSDSAMEYVSSGLPLCTLRTIRPGSFPGVWCPTSDTYFNWEPSLAPRGTRRSLIFTPTSRHFSRLSCSFSFMPTTCLPNGVIPYCGTWIFSGGHRPQSLHSSPSGLARQPRHMTKRLNSYSFLLTPLYNSAAEIGTKTSRSSFRNFFSISCLMCVGSNCFFCCSICALNWLYCGWFFGTLVSWASSWAFWPSTSFQASSMFLTSCMPPLS
mmetsp:Transcript_105136/g.322328  ORF Transcript_105136/g.322328 Transcript_105136/m.322328 type:complete len:275 (-) Transcript_105136:579-1403(-)